MTCPRVPVLPCLLLLLLPLAASALADTLEVEGGQLFHESSGEGFPLVLLHDELTHRELWDDVVEAFASDYRVLRYDRRGHGLSPRPEAPFSQLADLDALLAGLELRRCVLVGCSAGAGLALDYAIVHPERVEALVLVAPELHGLGATLPSLRRMYQNFFGADDRSAAERWVADPMLIADGNEDARERLRALLERCPQDVDLSVGAMELVPTWSALERLDEVQLPTLVVVGAEDDADVQAHAGAIEAGVVGARRVVLEGVAHLPPLERPRELAFEMREFLSLVSCGPGHPRLADHPAAPWGGFEHGFVPLPGSAMYYEAMGEGEPLVLLHGGAEDHRMWDGSFEELARGFRVIRCDLRGQGLTRSPFGHYRHYEDVGRLLDHLDLLSAHLLGLSLGGRVAADLSIAHPERVRSLVLVSPGLSGYAFDGEEEQASRQRLIAAWMSGDWEQAAEEFVRSWCDGPRREPSQTPAHVRERVKSMALQNVRPDREQGGGRELEPPAWGRLAEIRAPTLAILGELDMPSIHEIVARVGEEVAGARVVRLPDAAHQVNLEAPEEFVRLVTEFVREHQER